MDGDNQYNAEGFGKVDAERFVRFATLPPVLHLQLKRFEFNMQTYSFEKVCVVVVVGILIVGHEPHIHE